MCLYLLLNTVGYNVYAHFCGEELQAMAIMVKAESCCGEDTGMKTKPGCCTEEVKQVVIKTEYLVSTVAKTLAPAAFDLFIIPAFMLAPSHVADLSLPVHRVYEVSLHSVPISLITQNFRI